MSVYSPGPNPLPATGETRQAGENLRLRIFRLSLAAAAVVLLSIATYWAPPEFAWTGPAVIVFVTILTFFPLNILDSELSLVHIVSLAGGLLTGPVISGWATLIGLLSGYLLRRFWLDRSPRRTAHAQQFHLDLSACIALQIFPLVASLLLFHPQENFPGLPVFIPLDIPYLWAIAVAFTFAGLHLVIFLADYALRGELRAAIGSAGAGLRSRFTGAQKSIYYLGIIELGPAPFVLFLYAFSPRTGGWPLVFLGAITVIFSILIYEFSLSSVNLKRRVQELSTLNQVSRALRSTLSLDTLLGIIQTQVTGLMEIDNFYVALYDSEEQRVWYPLAVKHGQRQQWQSRPLSPDRLTDRVIQEGQPVSLAPRRESDPSRIGLPASEETPSAWMGVPLITANRTIGCLAVFSFPQKPGNLRQTAFTQADLNLLTTLSGQVSVAIENALLYDQAQRHAAQLENLNRISALITASLNPDEVLGLVCRSIAQFGGNRSAIFLHEPDKGEVFLAHAFGLSEHFTRLNRSFPITDAGRMRCLRTGRPVLSPEIASASLPPDYLGALKNEGIRAFGEFPLTTPEAGSYAIPGIQTIGFLAVYYDAPHNFRAEELDLINTFASQAAIAVSNARLYAHVDSALSRRVHQLSILESIGRDLAAAIHSERLFEMILDHAMNFTNSRWGELSLYNSNNRLLEVKAARGYALNRIHYTPEEGLAGKAVATRKAIHVNDVRAEPAYIDLTGGEARSQLCIPLTHEEGVLGVISLQSEHLNAYTENDQNFISQLATQAAIAVVNAQLYSQTQRRLRELSVLYLVSTHLVSNPDIQSVMQTLARSVEAALQTSSVGIYLWDEREKNYQSRYFSRSTTHPDCALPEKIDYAGLETFHPQLIKTGPLLIPPQRGQDLLGQCQNCQVMVFPLVSSQPEQGRKQRLGMVLMHLPLSRVVQDEDLQLMRTVVAQGTISLQNAILFQDVSQGRDQMAAVLNSVGEGILMIAADGRIVLANEFIQTITGYPRDFLMNSRLADLPENALRGLGYTPAEAQLLIQNLSQGKAPESPRATHQMGEKILERSTSPVWGQNERLSGWLIVIRDVTEEHQVAQARELITGTLVHDLRSPVGSVISALAVIDEILPEAVKDDVVRQALRVARHGSDRVLGMINTLLDISRMQSGHIELILTTFNLHTLVAGILDEFVPQANEYGLILRNEVPRDLPAVYADQNKITRVLANLVDNALKFTPAGGQVVVLAGIHSTGDDSEEVTVQVCDTGPGIPAEYRERIFDRFTQVPGMVGRRRGSGLGLTFCRMAVEAHGGQIRVENRPAPETGSIFTITLPQRKSAGS